MLGYRSPIYYIINDKIMISLTNPVVFGYTNNFIGFLVFINICFIIIYEYIYKNELHDKKKIFYVCLSIVIVYIIFHIFTIFEPSWLDSYHRYYYTSLDGYSVIDVIQFIIDCILYFAPFIMLIRGLDTISICPKCGASLTSAGKFCDNCGEQLSN